MAWEAAPTKAPPPAMAAPAVGATHPVLEAPPAVVTRAKQLRPARSGAPECRRRPRAPGLVRLRPLPAAVATVSADSPDRPETAAGEEGPAGAPSTHTAGPPRRPP